MFCTLCGTNLGDQARFCAVCGSRVGGPAPYVEPEVIKATPMPAGRAAINEALKVATAAEVAGTCGWCRAPFEAGARNCSRCGTEVGLATIGTRSGWIELPGRKDMSKIQIGDSFCQITGSYVPVADFNLVKDDWVHFWHHVLLWKEPGVEIFTTSSSGEWKRMFGGRPLIRSVAKGPGHIAFSQDTPGELVSVPLSPGQGVDVRENLFLAATYYVRIDCFIANIWYMTGSGGALKTHHPIGELMDRFCAEDEPGLLLLHAAGNVFVRHLRAAETILIKPRSLIFKDPDVKMNLHIEDSGPTDVPGSKPVVSRHIWLRLTGPGRVAVQSVFSRHDDIFGTIVLSSGTTERNWHRR